MTPARWTLLVISLLLVCVVAMFTVQNLNRTTDLSLDLWVWAGHLGKPQPVPLLLIVAFAVGLVLGGGWGLVGRMRASGRVALLEQDLARASLRSNSNSNSNSSSGKPASHGASQGTSQDSGPGSTESSDPWG